LRAGWLALSLLGCGGPPAAEAGATGLGGLYLTTSHTVARPCDETPQPVSGDDSAYFRIDEQHLDRGWSVSAHLCASPSTCDQHGPPLFQGGYAVGNGRVFIEQLSRTGDEDGHCQVTWTGHLVVPTEGGATLREEVRAGEWTGPPCTVIGPYVQSGRNLECRGAEVWVGKKL
jgi:hypothetical protein